ncbi:MAG: hypothetical protein H7A19_00720 [Rhodanobacteraceae bacterium]|nr:hypothetical protein [Rhodanobacteraceae bacterium]
MRFKFGPMARTALVGLAVLTLAACGQRATRPESATADVGSKATPEEQVKRRAVQRWDLLIERDFDKAYDLLSPGYREVQTRENYVRTMKDRPVQWTSVFFQKATCEPDVCTVEIQVNAQFQMPVMRVGTVDALNVVTENWILSDGEWYLVPNADR